MSKPFETAFPNELDIKLMAEAAEERLEPNISETISVEFFESRTEFIVERSVDTFSFTITGLDI